MNIVKPKKYAKNMPELLGRSALLAKGAVTREANVEIGTGFAYLSTSNTSEANSEAGIERRPFKFGQSAFSCKPILRYCANRREYPSAGIDANLHQHAFGHRIFGAAKQKRDVSQKGASE
jgi:hypothetical protein